MGIIPYESRSSAGKILAQFLLKKRTRLSKEVNLHPNNYFVFAIPNGGVPVAEGFCSILSIPYDLLIVRKISVPYNPEAGFGSITTDGTVILNKRLLSQLHLRKDQIDKLIELTKKEIQERLNYYEKNSIKTLDYKHKIQGKVIFLLDDGLASGYTMLAAVKMIKAYGPNKVIITVPTAPLRTIRLFDNEVDFIECPNVKKTIWFAVADAYKHWYDVSDSEVKNLIQKSKFYNK